MRFLTLGIWTTDKDAFIMPINRYILFEKPYYIIIYEEYFRILCDAILDMIIDKQPTVFASSFVCALFNNSILLCCDGEISSLDHLQPSDTRFCEWFSRIIRGTARQCIGCTMSLNIIIYYSQVPCRNKVIIYSLRISALFRN